MLKVTLPCVIQKREGLPFASGSALLFYSEFDFDLGLAAGCFLLAWRSHSKRLVTNNAER
jgi:hypothetical protein